MEQQLPFSEGTVTKPCLKCGELTNMQLYSYYPAERIGNLVIENRPYHKDCAPAELKNQPYAVWSFIDTVAKFAEIRKSKDRSKGTFRLCRVKR